MARPLPKLLVSASLPGVACATLTWNLFSTSSAPLPLLSGIGSSTSYVLLLLVLYPPQRSGAPSPLIVTSWFAREPASIFFTTTFAIWKCRNDVIFCNSRASQTKVKLYLTEPFSASLSYIAKPFSCRSLQKI